MSTAGSCMNLWVKKVKLENVPLHDEEEEHPADPQGTRQLRYKSQ